MAGLLDLLSGRSSDIYGQGLLTPEQRGGLGNIGLLALAGKLGQLAGPSFSPVPDFGAALGQAAGAYGASQEGAGTAALNAILTGQKGRKLEQELDYYKQLGPILGKLAGDWPGAGGGAGGGEGSGSTGGGAAAPPGAGGGGGEPSEADIIGRESGGKPYVGYGGVDLSNAPLNEYGFPIWSGKMGPSGISHAAGLYQFQPGTWATYAGPLGIKDFSPESQRKVYLAARAAEGARPWAASAGGGGGRAAAAPTAAAPAGGGGFLAPTAPNPLSDAEPMVGIPRPAAPSAGAAAVTPNQVGRFAGVAPGTPVNSRGFPYNPEITDPAVAARVAQSMAAIKQAQQSGKPWYQSREGAGGGGPLAAPLDAGGDPIMSVTSADQAGGGDAPAAPPRAGLPTMGPAGIELPPMQGPLAAPAPAAAAPAAPGPGLLAAPGALPRGANPAYDTYLRNLGIADVLAKGAGLPGLSGLTEALKASPGYAAELERARQRVGVEFAGPKTTAEKTAAEPFAVAASERELKNALIKEGWQLDEKGNAVPIPLYNDVAAAKANAIAVGQERPKLDSALAQQNRRIVYDANGKPEIIPITGGAETDARAAQLKTAAEALEKSKTDLKEVQVLGPNGPEKRTISVFEYNQRQQQARDRAAGTPQIGDIVGEPVYTKAAEGLQGKLVDEHIASRTTALTARDSIENTNELRSKLDQGIFTGTLGNWRLGAAKLGDALGFSSLAEPAKVKATEVFIARLGSEVANTIRSAKLGPPTSDRDLAFAQSIAGGNNLNEGSIRELLDIREKYNRLAIERHNKDAAGLNPRDFGGFKPTVDMPAPYKQTTGTSPSGNRWEVKP